MINRDKFIRAFDDIVPSERVIDDILKADIPKRRVKYRAGKFAVVIVCLFIIMSLGIVASAGDILDFDEAFGNYIYLDDSTLSAKLSGTVSNVKYTVSDNNFCLNVKGAFATDNEIIALIEISANDGKSVKEHFERDLNDKKISMAYCNSLIKAGWYESMSENAVSYLSDDDNIEIMLKIPYEKSEENVSVTSFGHNFYLQEEYSDFRIENNVIYERLKHYKGYIRDMQPVDIDDSAVRLLALDWKIKFDFSSSDVNTDKKICNDLSDKMTIYHSDYENNVVEAVVYPVSVEVGAARTKIKFYTDNFNISKIDDMANQWYIIKSNGEYVSMATDYCMTGGTLSEQYEYEGDIGFSYETDGIPTILNVDDVSAVVINGAVFEVDLTE